MASFQKRGNTWQYTISHKPKPIRKSGFRTKKEAQLAAAEVETALKKGAYVQLREVLFVDYFKDWVEAYKTDITRNTLSRYHHTAKTLEEYFHNTKIQAITKRTYQAFLNEYAQTHSKATVSKLNTHVRACVRDAIEEGIISVDVTRNAKVTGNVPAKKPSEKHLSYFESKRLMNALYGSLDNGLSYYLLLLGLTSGMRFAEMVGLTRRDFDFAAGTISIDKEWGYTKRMSTGFMPTKNEPSVRVIKMDKRTMDAFEELFGSTPPNIHGLVFFSPGSKYQVISNTAANNVLRRLLTKLNITPITVHGLRHTHASILLYKKVSIYYVSERLGHSDIQTTLSTYSHVIKELRTEDEKSSIDVFEKMLV